MNTMVKSIIVLLPTLLFTALSITGCSSDPKPQEDPYNQDDTQRSRAKQAQDELSTEIDRQK
jgi:PBP1b-binding outer membrane lipoprotein LpoB